MIYREPGFLGFVIRLHAHPPSATCLSFSVFLCVAAVELTDEREEGVGEESNYTRPREGLALYKSFNILC
jgi:hypothetical protein